MVVVCETCLYHDNCYHVVCFCGARHFGTPKLKGREAEFNMFTCELRPPRTAKSCVLYVPARPVAFECHKTGGVVRIPAAGEVDFARYCGGCPEGQCQFLPFRAEEAPDFIY